MQQNIIKKKIFTHAIRFLSLKCIRTSKVKIIRSNKKNNPYHLTFTCANEPTPYPKDGNSRCVILFSLTFLGRARPEPISAKRQAPPPHKATERPITKQRQADHGCLVIGRPVVVVLGRRRLALGADWLGSGATKKS